MNTQLGSTMLVVSGCFVHPSAAPVAGRSLAGQASLFDKLLSIIHSTIII